MKSPTKVVWFWAVTLANAIVLALLIWIVYQSLVALAYMANVEGWPLICVLATGVFLSIRGRRLAKNSSHGAVRRFGAVFHSLSLAIDGLVIGAIIVFMF